MIILGCFLFMIFFVLEILFQFYLFLCLILGYVKFLLLMCMYVHIYVFCAGVVDILICGWYTYLY